MRRYLSNPFSHTFHSSDALAPSPTPDRATATHDAMTNMPTSPIVADNNVASTTAQPACSGEPTLSNDSFVSAPSALGEPNASSASVPSPSAAPPSPRSYLSNVPSLPIPIPSVRKYLFSGSSNTASPHQTPESPQNHHHHHHIHLPNLAHLRRRNSGNSNDIPTSSSPRSSVFSDMVNNSLPELAALVDKTFGPVGHLKDFVAKRAHNDRLVAILNRSVQDRNRVLSQFLRARQFNPADAMHMLSNAVRWRNVVNIENYLKDNDRNMCLPSACFPMAVVSTPDDSKQPVIYGLIRLLDKKHAERVPFQNALLSFLESSYFGDSYAADEMVVILDFRDWSIRRNTPYRLVKDGIQMLQDYYPERLGRVFLVNYPTTIRAAYTVISPIIDAGAKEKIVWIPDADPSAALLKHIPPTSIPTFLGGELKARFPSSWPDIEAEFVKAKASHTSHSYGIFHH